MKLRDISRRVVHYYRTGTSIYLRSSPGRGKSTVIEGAPAIISKALGKSIGISILSAPLMNPTDTVGYLLPAKDADGRRISEFTKPAWWTTEEGKPLEAYDGGIVFIDEADKADTDMKKVFGEMALSGRCGPHRLPPGWVVWMAGNLSSDRSGSTKEFDHLINRRREINVDDDIESWEEWATAAGVHPTGVAFAMQNPQVVFTPGVPDKQGPWCTPRSLVIAINDLSIGLEPGQSLPSDDLSKEDVAGIIGQAACAQFFATVQLEATMPRFEDVINDPLGTKLPAKPDGQMLVAYTLAHRVTKDVLGPVISYVQRMPAEFAALFCKSACRRDVGLVYEPAMAAWASKNATLMNAIVANKG